MKFPNCFPQSRPATVARIRSKILPATADTCLLFSRCHTRLDSASDALDPEDAPNDEEDQTSELTTDESEAAEEKISFIGRARKALLPKAEDAKLTTKQRLAKLGLSAVLTYGWVSNVSYTVGMSVAWFLFTKRTGLSPLAKDQWKPFLAVYAGIWVFNNVIRPIRVAIAIAITPFFDRIIEYIQTKLGFSRAISIALVVFLFNIVGTTSLLVTGVALASTFSGVPVFPSK